jgi:hypothetical protein
MQCKIAEPKSEKVKGLEIGSTTCEGLQHVSLHHSGVMYLRVMALRNNWTDLFMLIYLLFPSVMSQKSKHT